MGEQRAYSCIGSSTLQESLWQSAIKDLGAKIIGGKVMEFNAQVISKKKKNVGGGKHGFRGMEKL